MRFLLQLHTYWQLAAFAFRRGQAHGRPLKKDELSALLNDWDSEYERPRLSRAIGNIAIGWATVEILYDYSNEFIMSLPACDEHKLPISLKPKLAFFKRHFDTLPELSAFREQAQGILERTNKLKIVRHDVVHGIAGKRLPNGVRSIRRLDYRAKKLVEYQKDYTLDQIIDAAEEIAQLAADMKSFLLATIDGVRDPAIATHSDSERGKPNG